MKVNTLTQLKKLKSNGLGAMFPDKIKIAVGMATCGLATGAQEVYDELEKRGIFNGKRIIF